MFAVARQGICRTVSLPAFGQQDTGHTPGGAMDLFSFRTGNILLGNPESAPALEMVFPPTLVFEADALFVLTGAAHCGTRLTGAAGATAIRHGRVHRGRKGDILSFGKLNYGFRTYLCFRALRGSAEESIEGRDRGAFGAMAGWMDRRGFIRVMEGPEYARAADAERFFDIAWTISRDTSDMGMRLEHPGAPLRGTLGNMVSAAVATGTIQLTPKGPIILLKHRQTVGGYPRIFTVASTDTDLLGQYAPGQKLRFRRVSRDEALDALRTQRKVLDELKARCGN